MTGRSDDKCLIWPSVLRWGFYYSNLFPENLHHAALVEGRTWIINSDLHWLSGVVLRSGIYGNWSGVVTCVENAASSKVHLELLMRSLSIVDCQGNQTQRPLKGNSYHGLSQKGIWVSFWTPKPLKSTPQDTQICLFRKFLKCQFQAYN